MVKMAPLDRLMNIVESSREADREEIRIRIELEATQKIHLCTM